MMQRHWRHLDLYLHILTRVIGVFLISFCVFNVYLEIHAEDLLEQAFTPAKTYDTVVNLGNTKNAVGNEIFQNSTQSQDSLWQWCFVNGSRVARSEVQSGKNAAWSQLTDEEFCQQILGGDVNVAVMTQQDPLLIRITKRLLRITIVLSITMVLYNWISYIVESAKWWEVKNATKNIWMIVLGILLALSSVVIINLLRSVTLSSLWLWG